MAPGKPDTVPFLKFPSEIRNHVYSFLLCAFEPTPATFTLHEDFDFHRQKHSIETAILRASRQVHREAYDVMVKSNKFVKIKSTGCVPVLNSTLLVLSDDETVIDQFPGFVLTVDLQMKAAHVAENDNGQRRRPFTVMTIARHMDTLCRSLADGNAYLKGFSEDLAITLTVAPRPLKKTKYKSSLSSFFSEKIQKELFAPFREILHGFEDVHIRGSVDAALAEAVKQDIAREAWTDFKDMLDKIRTMKDLGTSQFRQREYPEASIVWQDAALEIELIRESKSWNELVKSGGKPFLREISELYFTLKLNVAHVQLLGLQNPTPGFDVFILLAHQAVALAKRSMAQDYWAEGFKFTPTRPQLAKLWYRGALSFRLEGKDEDAKVATACIAKAARYAPGDAVIAKEQRAIEAWSRRVS